MSIRCSNSQTENPETATFCADCGTKLISPKHVEALKKSQELLEMYPDLLNFNIGYL